MSVINIPTTKLSNGQEIQVIGYGTFKSTNPEQLVNAIKSAIELGYRHFDCAWCYRNEDVVGKALKEVIESGFVKREDLFITGKIWNTHHSKEMTRQCLNDSLNDLGFDYVDLLLLHWPMGYAENTGKEPFPFDDNGKMRYSDVHYLETYHAMEELLKEGKTKSIGLSNFNIEQIQDVLNNSTIKPVMLQYEVNPLNQSTEFIEFCQENDISVTAYCPLGANDRGWMKPTDPVVLQHPIVLQLAAKYNKSPAQICIKWTLQRGLITLVKSVTPSRIRENIDVFDFTISDEDMAEIKNIKETFRYYVVAPALEHKFYPYHPKKQTQ